VKTTSIHACHQRSGIDRRIARCECDVGAEQLEMKMTRHGRQVAVLNLRLSPSLSMQTPYGDQVKNCKRHMEHLVVQMLKVGA
jgi:hypothetical protein